MKKQKKKTRNAESSAVCKNIVPAENRWLSDVPLHRHSVAMCMAPHEKDGGEGTAMERFMKFLIQCEMICIGRSKSLVERLAYKSLAFRFEMIMHIQHDVVNHRRILEWVWSNNSHLVWFFKLYYKESRSHLTFTVIHNLQWSFTNLLLISNFKG